MIDMMMKLSELVGSLNASNFRVQSNPSIYCV